LLSRDSPDCIKEKRCVALVRLITFWHSAKCVRKMALDDLLRLHTKLPFVGTIVPRLN
jgi:hypothetical protein